SIPRRIELVKEKARDIKLNPDLERIAQWLTCALSKLPLEQPAVSCGLGKLYNQDAVIEYLLDRSAYGDGDKICSHITSVKDTVKLNLTPNPDYNEKTSNANPSTMGNLEKDIKSKFICPISMKEMNGKHRFVYLNTCGCAFAEQALKEIPSKECVSCGKSFESDDVVVINPNKEELEIMKKKLEEKKAKAKAERKAKKAESRKNGEEKKRKRTDIPDKPSKKVSNISTSGPTAIVMEKVAQDLSEKKKPLSNALKSIFEDKNKVDNGNYLTKGTFNRY
ncbi:Protein RTF2, partial [Rhizopus stolonifer]